jgi:hypothetical protein
LAERPLEIVFALSRFHFVSHLTKKLEAAPLLAIR